MVDAGPWMTGCVLFRKNSADLVETDGRTVLCGPI